MTRHQIAARSIRALAATALFSWSGTVVSTRQAPRQEVTYRGVLTTVHFDVSAPLSELVRRAPESAVDRLPRDSDFTSPISFRWGADTDMPVSGDYDGDGITDVTVSRPSTGQWFALHSTSNFTMFSAFRWGPAATSHFPDDRGPG